MMLFLLLLVVYQVKHYVADYSLQGEYMLGKFKAEGWVLPLSAHCFVHASMTLGICGIIAILGMAFTGTILPLSTVLGLAVFDFVAHFIMDRVKASPKMMGRYKAISAEKYLSLKHDLDTVNKVGNLDEVEYAQDQLAMAMHSNRQFWLCLGLDQMVHHLTHYVIIFVLLKELI